MYQFFFSHLLKQLGGGAVRLAQRVPKFAMDRAIFLFAREAIRLFGVDLQHNLVSDRFFYQWLTRAVFFTSVMLESR
jgi:uncharacterized membrane protein